MLFDGGSGALQFQGWFDSMLNEPCQFTRAKDGVTRCLPHIDTSQIYADSSCTQKLIPGSSVACAAPVGSHVTVSTGMPQGCDLESFAVFKLGAPTNVSPLYEGIPGSCNPSVVGGEVVQPLGDEVDPTTFVAATLKRFDTGDGIIAADVLVADDGAEQVMNLADEKQKYTCDDCLLTGCMTGLGDALHRCAPPGFSQTFVGQYADASCSNYNVVEVQTASACTPVNGLALVGAMGTGNACDPPLTYSIATVGAAVDPFGVYVPNGNDNGMTTCEQATLAHPPSAFHALGTPVSASMFLLVPFANVGQGRLSVPALVGKQGNQLVEEGTTFLDTQTGDPCTSLAFDGGSYCVPLAAENGALVFTDAACTVPASTVMPPSCAKMPPALVFPALGGACTTTYVAYAVGQALPPSQPTYVSSDGVCMPAGMTDGLFALTIVDPKTVFPPVASRTE